MEGELELCIIAFHNIKFLDKMICQCSEIISAVKNIFLQGILRKR
jgi:hypothetical protein